MEKTKMGISVAIVGAALYLLGLINTLAVVVLAGYVLLMEENAWLRKAAVKAVAVILLFTVATEIIGLLDDVFAFFNAIIGNFAQFRLDYPLNLDVMLRHVLSFAKAGLLMLMGLRALHQGSVKVGAVDKLVQKHM